MKCENDQMMYATQGPRNLLLPLATIAAIFVIAVAAMLFAIDKLQPVLAKAAVLDLMVTGPLVCLLFLHLGRLPLLTTVPVTTVGLMLAEFFAPDDLLPQIALAKWFIFPVLGCVVVRAGYLGFRSLKTIYPRFSAIPDARDRLRAVLTSFLGHGRAVEIILSDMSFLWYAFVPPKHNHLGPGRFTSHQRSGLVPLLWGFAGVMVLETVVLHLLVHLASPKLALILTSLSLYSLLSLIGHIRALPRRYTTLHENHVTIRTGLFDQCDVPYCQVSNILQLSAGQETPQDARRLGMLGALEPHNLLLCLHSPCNVKITHGITQQSRKLILNMDDPQAFSTAIIAMRDRCMTENEALTSTGSRP